MSARELAEALSRQRRAVAPGMLVIPGPKADQVIAALERAERVEAAARVLDGAWGRWNANLAVIGGGADNMDRFVALETAFTELRAALAPAPGEEGKG